MSEANNNATSFNSESNFEFFDHHQVEPQVEVTETLSNSSPENNDLPSGNLSELEVSTVPDSLTKQQPLAQKMNWQKVAHKLREYNRKLLKKVFRLEQELAEIDNKFNKHLEKSQSSDLLVAQQAEEIKKYQDQIATIDQQLAESQQQMTSQQTVISNLSLQRDLSEQRNAQMERECTLLQEKYNNLTYELVTKEKQTKELQTKLNQQQRSALQYKAELQRHLEKAVVGSSRNKLASQTSSSKIDSNRSIKPWSPINRRLSSNGGEIEEKRRTADRRKGMLSDTVPAVSGVTGSNSRPSKPTIVLPQTEPQLAKVQPNQAKPSQNVTTVAKIADWSAASVSPQEINQSQAKSKATVKSSSGRKKPQSLAAVDLPTFPRPN